MKMAFGNAPWLAPALLAASLAGWTACSQASPEGGAQSPPALSVSCLDLNGGSFKPFVEGAKESRFLVFFFVSTDCPISNRYAPEMKRIASQFSKDGVRSWLVYADPDTAAGAIRKHTADYLLDMPALRDPQHQLVRQAKARVTPEVAVFNAQAELIYHGRIDDRYVDFGKDRPEPTQRELHEVLAALVAGHPPPHRNAPAVGCYIPQP